MFEEYGFNIEYDVLGRASVADLFTKRKRCGIYILHFSNGQYYIGQSKDVTRRYVQHKQTYSDIVKISFQKVKRKELNDVERATIWALEKKGVILRNITFASLPKGDSDFDLIMPISDQNKWLDDLSYVDLAGERIQNKSLRRRYTKRYQQFFTHPQSDRLIEFLRSYVRLGIPAIKRGEVSFWSLSCCPGTRLPARLNINWQEVLSIYGSGNPKRISCVFHCAASLYDELSTWELLKLRTRYPFYIRGFGGYKPGGQDQLSLSVSLAKAVDFIHDPIIAKSIRLFNLRLMKKGACVFGRNHCLDLADHLVD